MRDHHLIAGNFLTVGKLVGKKMRRKAHFHWVTGGPEHTASQTA
jgi:hypothetical protein